MDLSQIMDMLNSEDGMQQMMLRDAFENEETGHTFSQAELIADVVNILRMDTKRMAEAHDVDISISKMTPERAAELLQGVAQGDDLGLIDIFDEIEDQRMFLLSVIEDDDAVDEYLAQKQGILYTVPDDVERSEPQSESEPVEEPTDAD